MTYHRNHRPLPRAAAADPLGGILSFFTDPIVDLVGTVTGGAGQGGSDVACTAARMNATTTLDVQTNQLARSWTADTYTIADMTRVRDQTMALLLSASRAIDAALAQPLTYAPTLRMAQAALYAKQSDSLQFTTAINNALAQGARAIKSTGFKTWVINSMNKSSVAIGHVAYMNCIKPGLASVMSVFQSAFDTLVAVVRAVAKTVIKTAQVVLKIPDVAGDMLTYAKYGAAAVAAWYVYKLVVPKKNPPRRR